RFNLFLFEKIERLGRDLEALLHAAGEDNPLSAVIQQFLHIGYLNPGNVSSSGFAPVPFARTAGKKLCILVRLGFSLDFESSPGSMFDPWGTICVLHSGRFVGEGARSRLLG